MSKTLATNIRLNRKNKGMTQRVLAEALFVSPQTVSKWELGASEPDAEKLCLMADLFKTSLDSLVRNYHAEGKKLFIAIDGGGTKTDFVLFSECGEVIDTITLGGSNPNAYGIEAVKDTLSEGIDLLIKSGAHVDGLFAGISGASVGNNRESLTAHLTKRFPYFKSRVEGDIHNVINSVEGAERCVAVICGTGSVAYGYDGHSLRRFGGWGYLFDHAGSGFDIGCELFRHALALEDIGESDEIYLSLTQILGGGIFENISSVYAKGKDYVASFVPIAFRLYDCGNQHAKRIIERCARRLSELIMQAKSNMDCGKVVIITGGLTSRRDILEPLISQNIANGTRLVFPTERPIVGAAVKCLKLYGGTDVDIKKARKLLETEIKSKSDIK